MRGDQILTSDLAKARPEFAALDGTLSVAAAPPPGARRTITSDELQQLAASHGLELPSGSGACFLRSMKPLEIAQIRAAMEQALQTPPAELLVEDFSKFPTPEGTLVMPPGGVQAARGNASFLWRGYVQYDGTKRFPVWAKVRVHVPGYCAYTTRTVAAQKVLQADDVREEPCNLVPFAEKSLRAADVAGWTSIRPLSNGSRLLPSDLLRPPDVRRGDVVLVKARHGRASLSLNVMAENSGRAGQVVTLRNPISGKRFQARVVGPGLASVVTAGIRTE